MDKTIQRRLAALAKGNSEYAKRHRKILNTEKKVLGVRTPDMRKLAKSVAKATGDYSGESAMDAPAIRLFIAETDKAVYEHIMLAGFIINYANLSDKERIGLMREYLKHADSWALVDLFAEKMKDYDRQLWWDFALRCLKSDKEFTVRYGVIILMSNYIDEESIDDVFSVLAQVKHEAYYVKMGMAWLYAEAAISFFEKTLAALRDGDTDRWTYRKALTKMLESRRFTEGQREEIRGVRGSL